MSLDPAQLEAAIRRNDPQAVRELLRDATEADRAASAKALKPFFTAPEYHLPEPVMLMPQQFMDFLHSGYQDKPAAIEAQEREMEERNRDYDAWRALATTLAFRAAQIGLAGGVAAATQLARDFYDAGHDWDAVEDDAPMVAAILADRQPPWLADFADRHLRQSARWPDSVAAWPLARALVRLGVIPRPEASEYATLMPGFATARVRDADGEWTTQTPEQALRADPGLLDDEIWRLFTVPEAGFELERHERTYNWWSSGGRDHFAGWAEGLAALAAAGLVDRGRLLDASLDAFTRDFHPGHVGWYATMLAQLQPSEDELAARASRYLRVLSAGARPAVKVGQEAAARLVAAGRIDPGSLLDASGPALRFPQKSIAAAQLKLIGQVAARHPELRPRAAATAATAFGHERQDVQEAALKLIRKLGVPGEPFLTEIRDRAADLSPSLAAAAAELGLTADRPSRAMGVGQATGARRRAGPPAAGPLQADPLAALELRIAALPTAAASGPVAALAEARASGVPVASAIRPTAGAVLPPPVSDPEELIRLLTILLEDTRDALAAERALAGAVRLSALPVADRARLAAPLVKRARQLANTYVPFAGDKITSDIALITLAWAGEELRGKDHRERSWHMPGDFAVGSDGNALTMAGIFSARAWEAARVIEAGDGGILLAEPETERGAITPATLRQRVRQLAAGGYEPAGAHDRDVALLRLAPGDAGDLWEAWAPLAGASAGALRDSHHAVQARVDVEAVTGLPTGAPIRDGRKWHEHVLARITGPVPPAPACRCWQLLTDLPDPLRQHEVLYGPARFESRHYDPAVAGWALICPWQPEVAAAHLLRPLSDGLLPGGSPASAALASLRHPGHPLGPVGHLALITGMASAAPDTRIAAAELWSGASNDGRLDPALAAAGIVTGVRGQALKLSRIADSLEHASHAPLAARRVVETVCAAADDLARPPQTGLHRLFELAARLATRVGMPDPPAAVIALAAGPGGSRLRTTAAQLTAARDARPGERGDAAVQALAAQVARAEAAGS